MSVEEQGLKARLAGLPGADLVIRGLKELVEAQPTECALLVLVAAPRLKRLGIEVTAREDIPRPYEHQLYSHLEKKHGNGAHSRYNSLIRRVVSFAHALERELQSTKTA